MLASSSPPISKESKLYLAISLLVFLALSLLIYVFCVAQL